MKQSTFLTTAIVALLPFFPASHVLSQITVPESGALRKQEPLPHPSGVVVVSDPATGLVRQASAAEIAAILPDDPSSGAVVPVPMGTIGVKDAVPSELAPRSHTAIWGEMTVHADGSRSVRVNPDSMTYMRATKTPEGKIISSESVAEKNVERSVRSEPSRASAPKGGSK